MSESEGGIGFASGKKSKAPDSLSHWWESKPETVAKDLTMYCAALELAQRPQRFRSYAYHMVATGRAPISYGLSMPGMGVAGEDFSYAGSELFNAEFTPPSENLCHIAIDTFENKIWCQKPFVQFDPPNDGNYKLRRSCKEATAWTDQVFNQLNVWDLVQAQGKDSGIVGTGWILGTADEAAHKITLERIDDDCILLDPTAGENPRSYQCRWFYDRGLLIQQYAVGKDKEQIRTALESTGGCRLGFFPLPIGYQDTIAVCAGWYLKRGESKGRYVLAVDNCVLVDKEFDDEKPPLSKMVHYRISGSVRGKGIVEAILPIQRELDRTVDNTSEQERVCAWNRVQTRVGNNVDPDTLSGNGIIEYTMEPVKFEQGLAPPPQLYQKQKDLRASGLFTVGITESQVQGEASAGVDAAVAMRTEMEISDVRHRSVSLQQEASVEDLNDLIIRLSRIAKPAIEQDGKQIDFNEVDKAVKGGKARAYPLSGLPKSIAGMTQEIEEQFKRGEIDKETYRRLRGMPVTGNSDDELTADIDLIYFQLDEMVETGKFQVILPFQNLAAAKDKAARRYQVEMRKGLDRKRLQLIAMYMAQANERLKEQGPSTPAAPPTAAIPTPAAPAPAAPMQGAT
jgi:hypothetical protein